MKYQLMEPVNMEPHSELAIQIVQAGTIIVAYAPTPEKAQRVMDVFGGKDMMTTPCQLTHSKLMFGVKEIDGEEICYCTSGAMANTICAGLEDVHAVENPPKQSTPEKVENTVK